MQVKVWLRGISPMVWWRLLVPETCTLRKRHGVIHVAIGAGSGSSACVADETAGGGWEGIHLDLCLRSRRHGAWEVPASSPDVTLAALKLRRGARFSSGYDLNIAWRHEVRSAANRLDAEPRKTLPDLQNVYAITRLRLAAMLPPK